MQARALLVDDEPANLRLLIEYLQHSEFAMILAQNGNEAIHLAVETQPELVLLDVRMPDMDGFMVYQRLLANPKTAEALVIFLSAIDDIEYKERALGLGGTDYITKPVNIRELNARIQAHLSRKRQYQAAMARIRDYELYLQGNCHVPGEKNCPASDDHDRTHLIKEYLLRNLSHTPSLNELAQIAHTNRTTINVQFRNLFGVSIFAWLGEQRLLRAAFLLRTSTKSIQNIADDVGYASVSALTHAFSRRFGCSPSEYRLQNTSYTGM